MISENAKILKPEFIANSLIKGIRKNKFMIMPGFDTKLTYFLKRHFPWVIGLFIKLGIRKARRSGE